MIWKDGWPLIGVDTDGDGIGEVVWQHEKPIKGYPVTAPASDDDFSGPELGIQWNWRFNPRMDRWSLTERPGFLRLKACVPTANTKPDSLDKLPNLIAQRTMGRHDNVITTKFDLTGMAPGQEAGLHVSAGDNNAIGVKKNDENKYQLFFKHEGKNKPVSIVNGIVIGETDLWLRATIENGLANFFYSLDGETFTQLGGEVRLLFAGFTPNMPGFYTMNTEEKGFVDIDWITYEYDGPKGK